MSEFYRTMNSRLAALMDSNAPLISNLSNAAALLYTELPRINWAGFYLAREEELLLGPFGGKPACLRIPFGKGVCGTAAIRREAVVVPDVCVFPGHIACDSVSRSEIVLPLLRDERFFGVLDIDSPEIARFSEEDVRGFSESVRILSALSGWEDFCF